jgi:hypothetical protein
MDPAELWSFLPKGYLFTIAVETPILLLCLATRHSLGRLLFAGAWLTACTYPIVVLVLPLVFDLTDGRTAYLLVAETFAPLAECVLFWAAFGTRELRWTSTMWRAMAAITLANLASFGLGEVGHYYQIW